jgi:predicted aspartyl protease
VKLKTSGILASFALIAFSLFAPAANLAAPKDERTPRTLGDSQITIRVHDYAEIKSGVLLQAERSAGNILRESGIDTNWVVCRVGETPSPDPACADSMTPLDFVLNLLPRSMAQLSSFRDEEFGVAIESDKNLGFYTSIFYSKVKDCATHEHLDLAPLLGHVIAHEIGHLLLGIRSHTDQGLMSASWSSKDLQAVQRKGLSFTSPETKRIQTAMIARRHAVLLGAEHRESLAAFGQGTESTPLHEDVASGELPFRLSSGYLIEVRGRIGSQSNLKLLVDTGSTISIVDRRIADKLKLARRPAESMSFERKLVWEETTVPEVQFGPIKAQNVQMLVGSLAEYSEFAQKADVVIGMDLLRLSNFSIDYDSRRIVFRSGQREYAPPAEPLSACMILELAVQGHPVRLIVDTGFPGLLLYQERLKRQIPVLRTEGSSTAVSVGGRLKAIEVVLPDVVFGTRNDKVSVLMVKAPASDALPGIDGVVGLRPLKARRIHFDFVAKRLSWE